MANDVKARPRRSGRGWTDEEEECLRRSADKLTYEQMAERLGRSIRAVKKRAWILGLSISSLDPTRNYFEFTGLNPELSYVTGVFMGDGWITHGTAVGLTVVDRDFAERFERALEKIFNRKFSIRWHKSKKCKQGGVWGCYCSSVDLAGWLETITKDKTIVPEIIKESSVLDIRAFLKGLIDSEGCISLCRRKSGTWRGEITFGITDTWIYDVKKLFEKIGVKCGKMGKYDRSGIGCKDMFRFGINTRSYIESGLGFTIKRKQDRLDLAKNSCEKGKGDWWPKEVRFLEENWGKLSYREIAKHLGRLYGSVTKKTLELKRAAGEDIRKERDWTDKEVQFLEKSLGKLSEEEIAKHLGRTCGAVTQKALRLKRAKEGVSIKSKISPGVRKPPVSLR